MSNQSLLCSECGIVFGIDAVIFALWKRDNKKVYCPNGHINVYGGRETTIPVKELNELRSEVKSLKEKLAAIALKAAEADEKVAELTAELEIWRPTTSPLKEDK